MSAEQEQTPARRGARRPTEAEAEVVQRGPVTPVQHEDDGWGDTPVQMRG